MAETMWGFCKDCKWWQIEPQGKISKATIGLCIEEKLQPFLLSVSGDSGCNRFVKGEPARAKGSGKEPATAKPVR